MKIGDRVRTVAGYVGQIIKINPIDEGDSCFPYLVRFDGDKGTGSFGYPELELIDEMGKCRVGHCVMSATANHLCDDHRLMRSIFGEGVLTNENIGVIDLPMLNEEDKR